MDQKTLNLIDDLEHVANLLKSTFIAKDDLVELIATCAVAQEHLLIVGPPGTAKSELIKRFALLTSGEASSNGRVNYFEYLLTRFTEPNEIFGPVDLEALQQGRGNRRDTRGMLPRAEIAFLDEVFKGNSAILNALLTLLNERVFYNGIDRQDIPLIFVIGATNAVPDDVELAALYDRFLLRVWTDNVEESLFPQLFERGWSIERDRIAAGYGLRLASILTTDALRALYRQLERVDLSAVEREYREVVRRIRAEGIQLSDRRVVKLLKLVAASALRQKRESANTGDFWVLRHVWSDADQIPHLQTIVDPYVEAYEGESWRAERLLDDIERDLVQLEARGGTLRTDTDYADFLQQLERLRGELLRHSVPQSVAQSAAESEGEVAAQRDTLISRIESAVDGMIDKMAEAR